MFYDGIVQILFNECLNVFDVLIKNYLVIQNLNCGLYLKRIIIISKILYIIISHG